MTEHASPTVDRKKMLPVLQAPPPEGKRSPDDGWIFADPYPMSEAGRAAMHTVISAVLPPPPAPQPEGIVEHVEDCMRRYMMYMHSITALGFYLSIRFLVWAPVFFSKHRTRMTNLSREDAAAFLDQMAHSPVMLFRTAVVGVRGLALSTYFDQDEVHEALDYAPIPFINERIARRRELLGAPMPAGDTPTEATAVAAE